MRVADLFGNVAPGESPPPATCDVYWEWDDLEQPADGQRYREVSFGLRPLDKPGRVAVYRGITHAQLGVFLRNRSARPTIVQRYIFRPLPSFSFVEFSGRPVLNVTKPTRFENIYEIRKFNDPRALAVVRKRGGRAGSLLGAKAWTIDIIGGASIRLERVRGTPLLRFYRGQNVVAATTLLRVTRPQRFGLEVYRCTEEEALLLLGIFYAIELSFRSVPRALRDSDLTVGRLAELGDAVLSSLGYPTVRKGGVSMEHLRRRRSSRRDADAPVGNTASNNEDVQPAGQSALSTITLDSVESALMDAGPLRRGEAVPL